MRAKPSYLILLVACIAIGGCNKSPQNAIKHSTAESIQYAQQYFNEIGVKKMSSVHLQGNVRLTTSRQLLWDQAFTVLGTNDDEVVCPVKYAKALYIHPTFAG